MLLCECDQNPPDGIDAAIEAFWAQLEDLEKDSVEAGEYGAKVVFGSHNAKHAASLEEMKAFAEDRMRGVFHEQQSLDAELEPFLQHWSLYRLGVVERTVLRLGAWELSRRPDIPAPIVINEAVDLAKFFSETQSGKFVNGVLDRFAKSVAERPFTIGEA